MKDTRRVVEWFAEMLDKGYTIEVDADNQTIYATFPLEARNLAPFTMEELKDCADNAPIGINHD